jgi:hypothetical protein
MGWEHVNQPVRAISVCNTSAVMLRGNFLSIPTDCPQRDERLGWTGDIQIFCQSANFHIRVQYKRGHVGHQWGILIGPAIDLNISKTMKGGKSAP